MMNNSKLERRAISEALGCLDRWFDTHDVVNTPFGKQRTKNGYQIREVRILPQWVMLTVYVLDRSLRENDDVRGGDEVAFRFDRKQQKIIRI